ncbi:MAG: hypothetical protein JF615_03940, partial [Asticcacaulis sp.]|nr:hypothetical protein [Asticcacaulis sp.]
ETVDIYVWKPAKGAQARARGVPREPAPIASAPPNWARIGRVFLAGLIMGVAGYKAVQFILKKDHV